MTRQLRANRLWQRFACITIVLAWGLLPADALAHQTASSTLNAEIRPADGQIDLLLAISPTDILTHLGVDPGRADADNRVRTAMVDPAVGQYLDARLNVQNDGRSCETTLDTFVPSGQRMSALLVRQTYTCERPLGEVRLVNKVLLDSPGGYTHYGQIQLGEEVRTTIFNRDTPTYDLTVSQNGQATSKQTFWDVFSQYLWQGVIHILLGIDHVLFVLCLLLAARRLRPLMGVITCFTVAHSITLGMSALEVVTVPSKVVEPLIALSIAWVAVELLLDTRPEAASDHPSPGKHLYILTFLFGLLHGFGFSSVLRDQVGLPTDLLVPALFSFNVGVELGQLAVVVTAFPLVVWIRRRDWGRTAVKAVAATVLVVSIYWFTTRLM